MTSIVFGSKPVLMLVEYVVDVSFKIVMSSLLCAYLPDAIF